MQIWSKSHKMLLYLNFLDRFCLNLVYRSIIGKKKGPNVFGDAALINYANLCKFCQNHIKCSYFLIS